MKTIGLLFFLQIVKFNVSAQVGINEARIELLDKQYHSCLDSGQYMLGCAADYYDKIDSCLNLVYEAVLQKPDANSKKQLRTEEIKWLKARDERFKSIDLNNKMDGRDGEMIRLDEKATFVKERMLALLRKYNK